MTRTAAPPTLSTPEGEYPLHDYRLHLGGREWGIYHTGVVLTFQDELHFYRELIKRLPYGVALWPSAIALAHEVASRGGELRGKTALELGAGTGLPGIVAASLGARVVQTDRNPLALEVCRTNGERNGVTGLERRAADWEEWEDTARYDFILGADILYGETAHPHLRRICEQNLAPGGRILLADPFRGPSLHLLEEMEADDWIVSWSRWRLSEDEGVRAVGIFDIRRGSEASE